MEKIIRINRPVGEVFAYIGDTRNSSSFLEPYFELDPLSSSTFKEGSRVIGRACFYNTRIILHFTVVEMIPGYILRLQACNQVVNGMAVDSEACWRFAGDSPDSTLVGFSLLIRPNTRNTNPFVAMLNGTVLRTIEGKSDKIIEEALIRLKMRLESETVTIAEVA
ncbi:MAG TPA: hypothetical protein VH186_33210 [Chloroflexia bacterium]|nr:hypothetical protein [Chloroflexia bacterium]